MFFPRNSEVFDVELYKELLLQIHGTTMFICQAENAYIYMGWWSATMVLATVVLNIIIFPIMFFRNNIEYRQT